MASGGPRRGSARRVHRYVEEVTFKVDSSRGAKHIEVRLVGRRKRDELVSVWNAAATYLKKAQSVPRFPALADGAGQVDGSAGSPVPI